MESAMDEERMRRELGRRLVQVRGRMTQEAHAAQLGVHVNTLARYERGERWPGADLLRTLADTGVDLHWLLTGEHGGGGGAAQNGVAGANGHNGGVAEAAAGYATNGHAGAAGQGGANGQGGVNGQGSVNGQGGMIVPGGGSPVGVPGPGINQEVYERPAALFFDEVWLRTRWGLSYRNAYLVIVQGDSMEPTLKAGDQVLVDRRDEAVPQDGLYLLQLGQGLIVRRLQRLPQGRCRVLTANPAYAAFTIDLRTRKRECCVLGRVVWAGQSV